jgi:ATP-dependent helicase/nuclease subunit B
MLEARRDGGRVDVICGKSGASGEPLLPSRILLAAERDELPGRVKSLFKEVEPPEAGMRWHADWKWTPRRVEPPKRLGVTSLGDYLACPFRYYLKHVLEMRSPEPNRMEWNARDFGTAAHEVLERWGRDPEARSLEREEAIQAWLSAGLDGLVAEWFGKRVPLAVRIQTESLRQRLSWFSRAQAATCQEGWEVVDVERKVELPVDDALIVAKIDRIDRHRETGCLRVLDYKTGRVDGVDKAHRRKLAATGAIPAHLSRDCPAVLIREEKGKSAEFLWQNLQLPLYAAALVDRGEPLPSPCYFTLRSTEADVGIHEWPGFDTVDLDAAKSCAAWIAGQIAARVFWPPAEKVTFDDFSVLAAGRELGEMTHFQSDEVLTE